MVEEAQEPGETAEAEAPAAEVAKRRRYGRRRVCPFCSEGLKVVDYKDFNFLRRFVSDRGRIETRRRSGTCAKHQRALAQAIKRARHIALLPFTPEHIRKTGVIPSRYPPAGVRRQGSS
jgi:small subunit ribosomal protein S18